MQGPAGWSAHLSGGSVAHSVGQTGLNHLHFPLSCKFLVILFSRSCNHLGHREAAHTSSRSENQTNSRSPVNTMWRALTHNVCRRESGCGCWWSLLHPPPPDGPDERQIPPAHRPWKHKREGPRTCYALATHLLRTGTRPTFGSLPSARYRQGPPSVTLTAPLAAQGVVGKAPCQCRPAVASPSDTRAVSRLFRPT